MTKHAPGPWELDDELAVYSGVIEIAATKPGIHQEANAVLIALAPHLLAVLEQIAFSDFSAEVARAKARAAVAEVEGR